jgi:integrase
MASLTDTKLRNSKPTEKPYKLQDGQGLFLEVRPSGAKFWRYRYWKPDGKDGIYTIGEYPAVSLSDARKAREWARDQVKQGLNPTSSKKAERLGVIDENTNTFESVAREWIVDNKAHWSATYAKQVDDNLTKDVFPTIGAFPIRTVKAAHLLEIIRKVEKRGAGTIAVLIRQWSSQIFRWAIPNQKAEFDPATSLAGALKRKPVRHNPPLSQDEIPKFLIKLDAYGGYLGTKIAVRLMLLTFIRTKELRLAEWVEFDLDAAEWRIPAIRMKMAKHMLPGEVHIVPLSRQAVALLRELHMISGNRKFLFPNLRTSGTCMTSTTINRVLERMGYLGQFSGHGFRTTASTQLHELGWRSDIIEKQLAHAERNQVKAAYNHAEYIPERREMMQAWADWIDALVAKAAAEGDGEAVTTD